MFSLLTDSLCYEIFTTDIYSDLESIEDHFDFSEYPHSHYLYSDKYRKETGKFKDELNGNMFYYFLELFVQTFSQTFS